MGSQWRTVLCNLYAVITLAVMHISALEERLNRLDGLRRLEGMTCLGLPAIVHVTRNLPRVLFPIVIGWIDSC